MPSDGPTLTMFRRFGFESWLARVKKDASVTSTMNQLADFIAWCKLRPELMASGCSGLQVLLMVATTDKDVPEKYNEFLHARNFRPSSILNRMDAVFYALTFMRCDLLLLSLLSLLFQIHAECCFSLQN